MGDADVEVDVEVEVEVEVEVPSTEATEETSKEGKKKREQKDPEPCEKPDEAAYQQAQAKFKDELAGIQQRIDAITAKIDAAAKTREEFRNQVKAAQEALNTSTDKRKGNATEIESVKQQYSSIVETRKQQREMLDPLRQGLKFSSRQALEEAILKIEARLATANLAPAFKKKYLDDINLLKSQRQQTRLYEERLAQVKDALVDPDPIDQNRKAKLIENKELLTHSNAAHAKKLAAMDEASKWNKDIEDQIAQRKVILEEKKSCVVRQNALGRQYNNQKYAYERYQSFLDYKKRQAAREKRAAEKAERVERAQARAAERAEGEQTPQNWSGDADYKAADSVPVKTYDEELDIISDLRRYLEFYKPKDVAKEVATQEAGTSQPRREFNEKKTVALLQKKNDLADEWGSVIGTSKPAKAPRGEAPKAKKPKDAPVNHIPQALAKFKAISVEPPLLTSQIDGVLKILDEKQTYYLELPAKEVETASKKGDAPSKPARELEEGEIEDDEADNLAAAEAKAAQLAGETLNNQAVEDLTKSVAAATIDRINDAIAQAEAPKAAEKTQKSPEKPKGKKESPEKKGKGAKTPVKEPEAVKELKEELKQEAESLDVVVHALADITQEAQDAVVEAVKQATEAALEEEEEVEVVEYEEVEIEEGDEEEGDEEVEAVQQ